jgi:hypothetical protein
MELSVKPILQALVVADHVYQDQQTGKKIICGTFTTFRFSRRPPMKELQKPDGTKQTVFAGGMHSGSPYAYVCLTDVCDGTRLQLRFVSLTQNLVLFGTEAVLNGVDRLSTVEMIFPLPPLPIQEPGDFALELVCENDILGSWRITAEEITPPNAKPRETELN